MNVKELRQEIKELAFEEASGMAEYTDIVFSAVNRAIQIIHSTVRPILGRVEINQTEKAQSQYARYDLRELAPDFMDFAGKVTLESGGRYREVLDYKTEGRSELLLPGEKTGVFTVWYRKKPAKITADTDENTELALDYDLHVLVPLLAAYFVWLDDDERKAVMYYNQYEDLKAQVFAGGMNRPAAVIEGGWRW